MRFPAATLLAALVLMGATSASANCDFGKRRAFKPGQDITSHGVVTGGGPCQLDFRGVVKSIDVRKAPAHGALTLSEPDLYSYAPTPGYIGPDRFQLRFCFRPPLEGKCSVETDVLDVRR